MAKRLSIAHATRLRQLEGARQALARADLSEAQEAAARAVSASEGAQAVLVSAGVDWASCLNQARFDPALSACLADRLLTCVATVTETDDARDEAQSARELREQEWAVAEARVACADSIVKTVQHGESRRREERGLTAVADRIAQQWSRP